MADGQVHVDGKVAVVAAFGRMDVLVNAAGTHLRRPTVATGLGEWRRVLEVNLTGPFLACKVIGERTPAGRVGQPAELVGA